MKKGTLAGIVVACVLGGLAFWKLGAKPPAPKEATPEAEASPQQNPIEEQYAGDEDHDDDEDGPPAVMIPPKPGEKLYSFYRPFDAPTLGPPNATIVIQMFNDLQCNGCEEAISILEMIQKDFKDRVLVVWRHYPLESNPNSMLAHEAATEVQRQGGSVQFWKMHDLLLTHRSAQSRANLERYAAQVGNIDMAKFKQALDTHEHLPRIKVDTDAVKNAGAVIEPPALFTQGRLFPGKPTAATVKAQIQDMLSRSQQAAQGATPAVPAEPEP